MSSNDTGFTFHCLLYSLNGDGPEVPNMKTLLISLKCAPDWYILGLYLGIERSDLSIIEADHQRCEYRLQKMLEKWLDVCTNPTWRVVVTALRSIGKNQLASEIERKNC